jgi:hypothetical protein
MEAGHDPRRRCRSQSQNSSGASNELPKYKEIVAYCRGLLSVPSCLRQLATSTRRVPNPHPAR